MKLFAKAGEKVTCENGHEICTVSCDIHVADTFIPTHLTNWKQPEPTMGATDIKCALCGALFWHAYYGQNFHFKGGWRTRTPDGMPVLTFAESLKATATRLSNRIKGYFHGR